MSNLDPAVLLKARKHLTIVHHVPGRVRLRFGPLILNDAPELATADGRAALAQLGAIQDVRVNLPAFSLVVQYDSERLPPESWERLIEGSEAEAESVVEMLRQAA
jgi:hypothetical protein